MAVLVSILLTLKGASITGADGTLGAVIERSTAALRVAGSIPTPHETNICMAYR